MSRYVNDIRYFRKQLPRAYIALQLKSKGYRRYEIAEMMDIIPATVNGLLRYARKVYGAKSDKELMIKAGIIK
jgi:DNA-binding CsgD family transcriptional regulator